MTLLNWPNWSEDSGYLDTGEGGLFAYAVWASPKSECIVDVHPNLFMGDVLVQADGPLRSEFSAQRREFMTGVNGADFNYERLMFSSAVSLGTVVFLGSTGGSFYDDRAGAYFTASRNSLTDAGLAVISALEAVYGPATYLTYLDT